jgi:hypothetical protein
MMWRVPLGAALVVLLALPATGFGWFRSTFSRSSYHSAPVMVYCYPVPVVAVTVAPAAPALVPAPPPPPPAPPRLYAEPQPAPPSGSSVEPPKAPPEGMPKAGVSESRKTTDKFFDAYFVAGAARPAADRCAVMFWNQSGRALTLTVDGKSQSLPAGQSARLDLKRDFAWSVTGRGEERQQVPAQESGVEIVIRR